MKRTEPGGPWAILSAIVIGATLLLFTPAFSGDVPQEEWKAPARASRKTNPMPPDEKSLAIGKQLYVKECLSCHGQTGVGDGPAAKDLQRNPGNLTSPKMLEQSDGALFWKITTGNKPMPSMEKTFTEDQRWHVVNYVRTLGPKAAGGDSKTAGGATAVGPGATSKPAESPTSRPPDGNKT